MNSRIGRLWRRRPEDDLAQDDPAVPDPVEAATSEAVAAEAVTAEAAVAFTAPPDVEHGSPEQPVMLRAAGVSRKVHVGDVLPPVRPGWPRSLIRLPAVPKRAILATGVCVGLVAPTVARHLALRLLLGPGGAHMAGPTPGTFEITRIVYHGPLTSEAVSTIYKALTAGRR